MDGPTPTTAANNTSIAILRTGRIPIRTFPIVISLIPIAAPLPDIARHIIKAVTVGRIVSYRSSSVFWILAIICSTRLNNIISPGIYFPYKATSGSFFPFCLGGKATSSPFCIGICSMPG